MSGILLFQEAPKAGKQMKEENVFKYFTLKYKGGVGGGGRDVCVCVDVLNGCLHTVNYCNW